jgi:hypothetical protein
MFATSTFCGFVASCEKITLFQCAWLTEVLLAQSHEATKGLEVIL